MEEINEWLQDKNKKYEKGLQLYSGSSVMKNRILQNLNRGYSQKNLSTLIYELRQLKNITKAKPVQEKKIPVPVKIITPPVSVQIKAERADLIHRSVQEQVKKIRLGDLPKELRPRYRRMSDIWYQMCELKFVFNDLPPRKEKEALEIILQIEALDHEKSMIWKEIDHWTKYKTLLPLKTAEDFSKLTAQQLYLKKVNLGNYIHKKQKRIENWKEEMIKETRKPERIKIQEQINRTLKSIHEHELNIQKIEDRL
ncbi:hypothetical protein SAMN04487764_1511 [Gillisia sp. Hel1_33_143]|uniref:hypothetical protein n=1 Tax=Gillisia sp. Hel1_33_143 TaxID=1336796 RepID=UPI000879C801|nr:hypothetical protein [Gillisia sp. Hel1_33_143]SDS12525.1 hypothetical protein SAMN04487764_1511 [Gillisia sp. Hel1_33_143]